MVVDFHVHCFADDLAERAVAKLAAVACLKPRTDGTVSGIKVSMNKAGIDKSVVLTIATKPQQTRKINQWAESIQDDKIVAFGSIHPECEDWEYELERLNSAGLKGIKFHPDYQEFYVDEPKMYPIYEKAANLGLIMIFHAGVDIGLAPPYHCTPERLKKIVRTFAGAKIIAAHMGGYDKWDEVEQQLVGENLYMDTSYSLQKMGREQFIRIGSEHGFDKILFATDSPWSDQLEELERLKGLVLPNAIIDAVAGGNAAKLLGLTC